MQLPVDAEKITGSSELVTVWDSAALRRQRGNPHLPTLSRVIDELGRGSKVAQGLNHVLTSVERLTENPGHRLYLLMRDRSAIGIIKVGVKKLFIRTKSSDLKEIDPLCVLDFYVCESEQRSGYGRLLYDTMLAKEGVAPHQLGYDRPSPKFLSFLRKHFGLSDYIPQTNNFVVFEAYFGGPAPRPTPATQVAFRPDARASAATESAPPQARGRVAPMPHSYVPQDALPSQTAPPAPIPLNTTPTNRLPALKATDGRPPQQQQQQGVPSKQAAEQPAMSQGRPNGLLQASLPSRQASSHHATATIPASVALAATLPSKSASQAAAAQRRDLSPSTRSSMAYNIITLEGAEALSKSCTPVRQTTGGYRR